MTELGWRTTGRSHAWRHLAAAGAMVVALVLLAPVVDHVFPRHGGTVALVCVAAGVWWALSRALRTGGRLAGVGLYLDDRGVTIGSRTPLPERKARYARPQHLHYFAPWSAVYDALLVTDRRTARELADRSWGERPSGRSSVPVATNPPFLAGDAPLLVFRVDLRRAEVPDVAHPPENAWAPPARLSHVWAVPLPDVDAVVGAFTDHGITVATPTDGSRIGPSDPEATDEEFYRQWLADPVLLHEDRPHVHRRFTGPRPRTLAEYEAACFFEHRDPRRPTDEALLWADERWDREHLGPDLLTHDGRRRLGAEYRRFARGRREQRRRRYGR